MDRLDRVLALVRARVPRLQIVHKREVGWMRAVGRLLRPINPAFEEHFTVVIGATIYLHTAPDQIDRDELAAILAHELVHQLDQQRWGPIFYLSYALLLPVGRTARAFWERRAYAVDLLIARERGGPGGVHQRGRIIAHYFTGGSYLWMWPGWRAANRFLAPTIQAVIDEGLDDVEPYRSILAAWRP